MNVVRGQDAGWNAALGPAWDTGEISLTVKKVRPIYDADARTKGELVERDRALVDPQDWR